MIGGGVEQSRDHLETFREYFTAYQMVGEGGLFLNHLFINSLLPLGRYINMDPYPTGLLISWI